jgi:hypothetical protein
MYVSTKGACYGYLLIPTLKVRSREAQKGRTGRKLWRLVMSLIESLIYHHSPPHSQPQYSTRYCGYHISLSLRVLLLAVLLFIGVPALKPLHSNTLRDPNTLISKF